MRKNGASRKPDRRKGRKRQRLRRSSDSEAGWRRRRCGSGFVYLDARDRRVTGAAALERIRALAIPPAWSDVWICKDADGHVQVTARDARGRKQYRYHPRWTERQDLDKFRHIRLLGRCLPALRRRITRDLEREPLDRRRVLAAAIMLLDLTGLRVGGREYLRSNGSHGLTTLDDRHLRTGGAQAELRFRGKSGATAQARIEHPRLLQTLRACRRLKGSALLQYRDGGEIRVLTAADVNAHLHELTGCHITAKMFRTWVANVRLLTLLRAHQDAADRRRAILREAIAAVAASLGNTAAVCRRAYLDPAIIDAWLQGELDALAPAEAAGLRLDERRYLRLARLRRHPRNGGTPRTAP